MKSAQYAFLPFEVDTLAESLYRGAEAIVLRAKTVTCLRLLSIDVQQG